MPPRKPPRKAGADAGDSDKTAAAIAASVLAEAITVPVMPRLIADDVTPEAAATLMAEQGGRLAMLTPGVCLARRAVLQPAEP